MNCIKIFLSRSPYGKEFPSHNESVSFENGNIHCLCKVRLGHQNFIIDIMSAFNEPYPVPFEPALPSPI